MAAGIHADCADMSARTADAGCGRSHGTAPAATAGRAPT
jgi:hypothetical protein